MRLNKILLIPGLLISLAGFSQSTSELEIPEYYGGEEAFYTYISQNLRYPLQARRMGIEGAFLISFDIDSIGDLTNVHLLYPNEDPGGISEEITRVLTSLPPAWIPADSTYNFILPVMFSLIFQGEKAKSFSFDYDLTNKHVLSEIVVSAKSIANVQGASKVQRASTESQTILSPLFSIKKRPKDVAFSVEESLKYPNKPKLVLGNMDFRSLSKLKEVLNHVKYLDIENNRISKLPTELEFLPNLEELYAPYNRISTLPTTFYSLKNLRIIGFADNKFRSIPDQIFQLEKLEILDLGKNQIEYVGEKVGNLKNLRVLILSDNKIEKLPASIQGMKHLKKLYLNGNDIPVQEIEKIKKVLFNTKVITNNILMSSSRSPEIESKIQEIKDDYSWGRLENGKKIGIWQFFDEPGELSLMINYSTGKLSYIKPDTSKYLIKEGDTWVEENVNTPPHFIGSKKHLIDLITENMSFPQEARSKNISGVTVISAIVDERGSFGQMEIVKKPAGGYSKEVIRALSELPNTWIQATNSSGGVASKLYFVVRFGLGGEYQLTKAEMEQFPILSEVKPYVIDIELTAFGIQNPQ